MEDLKRVQMKVCCSVTMLHFLSICTDVLRVVMGIGGRIGGEQFLRILNINARIFCKDLRKWTINCEVSFADGVRIKKKKTEYLLKFIIAKAYLNNIGVDGKLVLRWVIKKCIVTVWIGLNWLGQVQIRDFRPDSEEPSAPIRPDDRDQCFAVDFGHGTPDEILNYQDKTWATNK